jgi:hypothetical protein
MLEGDRRESGWLIVAVAVVSLVAFAGLLWVRGGSPSSVPLGAPNEAAARPTASARVAASPRASSSGAPRASRAPGSSGAVAAPTSAGSPRGAVGGATSDPTADASPTPPPSPTRTPAARPSATASEAPSSAAAGAAFRLPKNPQKATVGLENGQGDCPNFPKGGIVIETSFALSSLGRLTAQSPSNHRIAGRVRADGSFSLSGSNPVERWVGTLTGTGGSGSYFVVSGGCTEGYETTIAFQP